MRPPPEDPAVDPESSEWLFDFQCVAVGVPSELAWWFQNHLDATITRREGRDLVLRAWDQEIGIATAPEKTWRHLGLFYALASPVRRVTLYTAETGAIYRRLVQRRIDVEALVPDDGSGSFVASAPFDIEVAISTPPAWAPAS